MFLLFFCVAVGARGVWGKGSNRIRTELLSLELTIQDHCRVMCKE